MDETSVVLPLRVINYSALTSLATFALLAAGMAWTAWKVRLRSALLAAVLFGMAALTSGLIVFAGYFPSLVWPPSDWPHTSRMLAHWTLAGLLPFLGAVMVTFVLRQLCRPPTHLQGTKP